MSFLTVQQLSYRLPSKMILEDINYHVEPNDFIILLGSNGSGKSSFIKLLHRQYRASTGSIRLHGKKIDHYHSAEFGKRVSVLTQNCDESLFPSMTVLENYFLLRKKFQFDKVKYQNEEQFLVSYLTEYNANLAHKLHQVVHLLSGGEKQALALAFCLLNPPELLLLDEHTSALDPKTSEVIMQLTQQKAKQHNITCLLTTHDMDLALRYGNRILMLEHGKVHKTYNADEKAQLTREDLIKNY